MEKSTKWNVICKYKLPSLCPRGLCTSSSLEISITSLGAKINIKKWTDEDLSKWLSNQVTKEGKKGGSRRQASWKASK